MTGVLPHSYLMHPLVIYTYMTTAIATSIALIICKFFYVQVIMLAFMSLIHSTFSGPNVFDSSFFIPELQKFRDILELAQQTIACTLAQKSKMMLDYLIERARSSSNSRFPSGTTVPSPQRSSPGQATSGLCPSNPGTEQLKHKVCRRREIAISVWSDICISLYLVNSFHILPRKR